MTVKLRWHWRARCRAKKHRPLVDKDRVVRLDDSPAPYSFKNPDGATPGDALGIQAWMHANSLQELPELFLGHASSVDQGHQCAFFQGPVSMDGYG